MAVSSEQVRTVLGHKDGNVWASQRQTVPNRVEEYKLLSGREDLGKMFLAL